MLQQAADFAFVAGGRDGRLDRDGQAVQRAACDLSRRIEASRLCADAFRIEVGEGIQLRIEPLDLRDVRFGQFGDGDLAGAQQFKLLHGRLQHDVVHGLAAGDCRRMRRLSGWMAAT